MKNNKEIMRKKLSDSYADRIEIEHYIKSIHDVYRRAYIIKGSFKLNKAENEAVKEFYDEIIQENENEREKGDKNEI